jgi:hypothetical protein
MWISILLLIHVVVFLLMKNDEAEKRDLQKRINGPFIPVAPPRFPECVDKHGNYNPDKQERERIAKINRDAVTEIDRAYRTVNVLRKLKRM